MGDIAANKRIQAGFLRPASQASDSGDESAVKGSLRQGAETIKGVIQELSENEDRFYLRLFWSQKKDVQMITEAISGSKPF